MQVGQWSPSGKRPSELVVEAGGVNVLRPLLVVLYFLSGAAGPSSCVSFYSKYPGCSVWSGVFSFTIHIPYSRIVYITGGVLAGHYLLSGVGLLGDLPGFPWSFVVLAICRWRVINLFYHWRYRRGRFVCLRLFDDDPSQLCRRTQHNDEINNTIRGLCGLILVSETPMLISYNHWFGKCGVDYIPAPAGAISYPFHYILHGYVSFHPLPVARFYRRNCCTSVNSSVSFSLLYNLQMYYIPKPRPERDSNRNLFCKEIYPVVQSLTWRYYSF